METRTEAGLTLNISELKIDSQTHNELINNANSFNQIQGKPIDL